MPEREIGIVKWFSNERGYGFIRREGAPDVFVHCGDIRGDDQQILEQGQRVEFAVEDGKKGPQAFDVTIIRKDPDLSALSQN